MKTKHHARQVEIAWADPEPFQLAVEQTTDGDRQAAEQSQSQQDRHEAEKHQHEITYGINLSTRF